MQKKKDRGKCQDSEGSGLGSHFWGAGRGEVGVAATPRHQRETTWMAGHENAPRVPLPP